VSGTFVGFAGIVAMLAMLLLRVPVALAMISVSGLGTWMLLGSRAAWGVVQTTPFQFVSSWTLSAIPMFMLMGYISFHSGMTSSMFALAKALLWRIPGGLGVSAIFACTIFASVSGSAVANSAAMGRITIPEMLRAGYEKNFACGIVASGGTIGALIPPSILLIMFGIFAQTSIIQLFLAGIGMGLATTIGYSLLIIGTSIFRPEIAPRRMPRVPSEEILTHFLQMWPVMLLLVGVFGGMFGGIFTATEAGAMGALMSLLIALVQRRLTFPLMGRILSETVMVCGALFLIGVGATMFTRFLAISGMGDLISQSVLGWNLEPWQLILVFVAVYLVLGTFMDGIGMMLLTLPIFLPIIEAQQISLVWVGVLTAKLIETSNLSPPLGMNVFVIKNVVGSLTTVTGIFRGVLNFMYIDIVVVLLCVAFPSIVMFIPDLLK